MNLPLVTTAHFGDALRASRKGAGLSIADLAHSIGYSMGTITSWETGDKRPPAGAVVAAIAAACKVEPEDLHLAAARDTGELRLPVDVAALEREGGGDALRVHLGDIRRAAAAALRAKEGE